MIGKTLNHYTVIEKLGEGGMAQVYLAEDNRLNRKIALKILPADMSDDTGRIKRFEREAKAIAALNHPNIVTIYSVEEADGVRFLTMELVDGKSLDQLIPEDGMDLADFFEVALPLVSAVSAAHRRGITHRDIKPGNVMVNSEGVVKLLDLGLAKLDGVKRDATTQSGMETLTQEGRVIGTVPYMAPEQLAGRPVDHLVDIFALGVVLHEMLTGSRPFAGTSSAEVISSILRDTPKRVSEIKVDLPNELGDVVRKCLDKNPTQRYQSADELRKELAKVQHRRGIGTASLGAETLKLRALKTSSKKNQWLIATGIAVGAAIVAGTIFSLLPGSESTTETETTAVFSPADGEMLAVVVESFDVEGGDIAERFSTDLADEVQGALDSVDGIGAIVWATPPGEGDDAAMARPQADYDLSGSVSWDEQTDEAPIAHMAFELRRSEDNRAIWSESFDLPVEDPYGLQRDIAAVVRSRIGDLLGFAVPSAPTLRAKTDQIEGRTEPAIQADARPSQPEPTALQTQPTQTEQPVPASATEASDAQTATEPGPGEALADIQLRLQLTSAVATGVITVYADELQIYRQPFQFEEKKGGILGRVGVKKKTAGELEDGMLVPPDTETIRVYVVVAQQPAKAFELQNSLRADATDRLVVEIRKKRAIEVRLE